MKMVSLTLSIPKDLKEEMDKMPDINWSAVARMAITERLITQKKFNSEELTKKLSLWNEFTKNSTMTEEEAVLLGRELNRNYFNNRKAKKK